jgi:hypothetical protein
MSKSKLTVADEKFIDQHITSHVSDDNTVVGNPFTGEEIGTTPLIATIVWMVQDLAYEDFQPWVLEKWGLTRGNAYQKFDRAKNIVLKLDSDVYMKILD